MANGPVTMPDGSALWCAAIGCREAADATPVDGFRCIDWRRPAGDSGVGIRKSNDLLAANWTPLRNAGTLECLPPPMPLRP